MDVDRSKSITDEQLDEFRKDVITAINECKITHHQVWIFEETK